MRESLQHALHLMAQGRKSRWYLLLALAVVVSGFEMLGAVLVYLLLSLVVDPGTAISLPLLGDVRSAMGDMGERALLLAVVTAMGAFFIMRALIQVAAVYVQQRIAHNFGARLTVRMIEGYLRLPYAVHLQRSSVDFIRNSHQVIGQLVASVFLPIIRIGAETIMIFGLIVVLVFITPVATGFAVILVGVAAGAILLWVQPRLRGLGSLLHEESKGALGWVQQSFHGVRDIKVLGRERTFAANYARARLRMARAQYSADTLNSLPRVVVETTLIGFILLFFGITVALEGGAQDALSVLGLFAYVGLRLQPSLQRVLSGFNELKFATTPLAAVVEDLRIVEEVEGVGDEPDPLLLHESLVFEGVSFRYENSAHDALRNVDLRIGAGEVVGICGPTGGGKTTLADLIAGLLEPTSGRVTIDGHDLRLCTRAWQRNLGMVSQMIFLTDETLRRNIALGVPDSEIDNIAVNEAIELARLSEFVDSLPDGLDTAVGERGVRISGGQRQRIAIARALYRRPSVLIFDEGTSALDNVTEAQLMASIEALRGKRTIVLIAHRLSTVRASDRIIFIDGGRVLGDASFDELRRSNPRFEEMVVGE